MTGIAKLSLIAFDCPDPDELAAFYGAITGWQVAVPVDTTDGDWVALRSDAGATLAFQRAPDHQPPRWPDADRPQQAHLDFDVEDLQRAEEQVLALGARRADVQPGLDDGFVVFIDPAGHPFCLCLVGTD